jgi:hypothetical protein
MAKSTSRQGDSLKHDKAGLQPKALLQVLSADNLTPKGIIFSIKAVVCKCPAPATQSIAGVRVETVFTSYWASSLVRRRQWPLFVPMVR